MYLAFLGLHVPFPFADFALYPCVVIKHNHESDNMLSPLSPPGELSNWGMALGSSSSKLRGIISNKRERASRIGKEGSGESGS